MNLALFTQITALVALAITVLAFGQRLRIFNRLLRPVEQAKPKGNTRLGILYAFTLGMAPWSKESTRRHWASYLRGVAFHLSIFLCLMILLASQWIPSLPAYWKSLLALGAGLGALFGLIGLVARFVEHNLKTLSTPDDYFAVALVSLFKATTALWLIFPAIQPLFYLISAFLLVYAPFGKIRHCIYFAYSRLFYGKFIGSHSVLPHSQQGTR